jgi:hypothetical protein
MKAADFEESFLHARAQTAKLLLESVGWKAGVVNPAQIGEDNVFLYASDPLLNWTWGSSVPRASFLAMVNSAHHISLEEATAFAANTIANASVVAMLDESEESTLAMAISIYISKTRTFQATEGATKACHFICLLYTGKRKLRPFALSAGPKNFIPRDDLAGSVASVVLGDVALHPEWF